MKKKAIDIKYYLLDAPHCIFTSFKSSSWLIAIFFFWEFSEEYLFSENFKLALESAVLFAAQSFFSIFILMFFITFFTRLKSKIDFSNKREMIGLTSQQKHERWLNQ